MNLTVQNILTATVFLYLALAAFVLSGCSMNQETYLSQSKASVQEDEHFERMPVEAADGEVLGALARHFNRYGGGAMELTVVYDPKAGRDRAMRASQDVARITKDLRDAGVENINPSILPVKGQGAVSELLVSYDYYTAHAPDDCDVMTGYKNNEIEIEDEYKYGCTIETVFAKQISRPKDMAGSTGSDRTDGRRASNIVERYRSGAPNEALEGLSASE